MLLLLVGNSVVLVEVVNSLVMEALQDTAAGRQRPQSTAAIFLPCMVQRMIGEARGIMVMRWVNLRRMDVCDVNGGETK